MASIVVHQRYCAVVQLRVASEDASVSIDLTREQAMRVIEAIQSATNSWIVEQRGRCPDVVVLTEKD